jgi:Predicted transcriptional regulators
MSEIPLKPIGKEDIRKLESALITMALFSPETLQIIKDPHERLTWVDSLYIAAASFARSKAGVSISKIAEELGVTEATVRRHVKGDSKAGEIIIKTYETISKEGFKIEIPEPISEELNKVKKENEELKGKLEKIKKMLNDLFNSI